MTRPPPPTSVGRRLRRRVLLAAIFGIVGSGCFAVFDFADYDTTEVTRETPEGGVPPIGEAAPASSFTLKLVPTTVSSPRERDVTITATIERRDGFVGVVTLAPEPATVAKGVVIDTGVAIAAGSSATAFKLRVARDAALGVSTIRFHGKSGSLVVTAEITLDVTGEPGEIDTPFGTAGIVKASIGTFSEANALLVVPSPLGPADDRVIVIGSSSAAGDAGAAPAGGTTGFAMARYFVKDGALDKTFGEQGQVFTPTGVGAIAIARQGTKLIVVGGEGKTVVARYSADGVLDTTFAQGGTAVVLGSTYGDGVAVRPDNAIVIGVAMSDQGTFRPGVYQLLAEGLPDGTFGDGGYGGDNLGTGRGHGVVLAPDGTAVFTRPWLAYPITPAGVSGIASGHSTSTFVGTPRALVHLDGGFEAGVLVVGTSTIQPAGLRFAAAKLRYEYFQGKGSLGQFVHDYLDIEQSAATAIAVDASDRLLIAGWTDVGAGDRRVRIARALPNGDLDTTFGAAGTPAGTTLSVFDARSEARAVAVTRSGRILVAGYSETAGGVRSFLLARYVP